MQTDTDLSPAPSRQPPSGGGGPVELELGDGSRLVLDEAASSPIVCRIDGGDVGRLSLEDTLRLSGQPFAGFRRLR